MSSPQLDFTLLDAAIAELPHPALAGLRRAASASLKNHGLPTARDEAWRYTNLAPIVELSNLSLNRSESAAASERDPRPAPPSDIDAHWLVVRNGHVDGADQDLGDAVRIKRLSDFERTPKIALSDAVSSLNAALMQDALVIEVRPGATVTRPIAVLYDDDASASSLSSQPRVLVSVGEDATVEFVELFTSSGAEDHVTNAVTEIHARERATVRWIQLQLRDRRHMLLGTTAITAEAGASVEGATIQLGGSLARSSIEMLLNGPGARTAVAGLTVTDETQHVDIRVLADHAQPDGTSRQTFRGIAAGRSRSILNSKALVRDGADGTDAEQASHNLLLSDRAEIDTKPELEIYADDVKCAHGATVGDLDADALFYLRSRGIAADQAARILTRAFANQIVDALPVAGITPFAEAAIDRKLRDVIGAGDE